MPAAHYFYSPFSLKELEAVVESHQAEFDTFLEDTFSEDELMGFEPKLDRMASVWPQPILSELTFDDFYPDPEREEEQRNFFASCRSCLLLENMPDLEANPFQVTYLEQLLEKMPEVLADRGGTSELCFKETYLRDLKQYRSVDAFISSTMEKVVGAMTERAPGPIDYLMHDIYKELDRLEDKDVPIEHEKTLGLYRLMRQGKIDSGSLLKHSGLNPKDFGDNLERLKFILKKSV